MPNGRGRKAAQGDAQRVGAARALDTSPDRQAAEPVHEVDPSRLRRAATHPLASSPSDLLGLQGLLGNRATSRRIAADRAQKTTGLPDGLKAGVEALSGQSMDDVNVHYGSSEPSRMRALAFTSGTDIHVAPGEEAHLPHELWHVAQQKQGRVSATGHRNGRRVNRDPALEQEADQMGERARSLGASGGASALALTAAPRATQGATSAGGGPIQMKMKPLAYKNAARKYLAAALQLKDAKLNAKFKEFDKWLADKYSKPPSEVIEAPDFDDATVEQLVTEFKQALAKEKAEESTKVTAKNYENVIKTLLAERVPHGNGPAPTFLQFTNWFNNSKKLSVVALVKDGKINMEGMAVAVDEFGQWFQKLKDGYLPTNKYGDVVAPQGLRLLVSQAELEDNNFTGLYSDGAGPCVMVGILLHAHNRTEKRNDIMALSHFDGQTDPAIVEDMYNEVVEEAKKKVYSDGYSIQITLAGGVTQEGVNSRPGNLSGADLFKSMSAIATTISKKDESVSVIERQSYDNNNIDVRMDTETGMNLYGGHMKGSINDPEKPKNLYDHPIALKAAKFSLANSKLLKGTNGKTNDEGEGHLARLKKSIEAAEEMLAKDAVEKKPVEQVKQDEQLVHPPKEEDEPQT